MAPNSDETKETDQTIPMLPTTIVTVVDLGNLQRELETLDNYLAQAAARGSAESGTLPKTTRTLETLAEANGLKLLDQADRERLMRFLQKLRDSVPVVHISFAAEPSAAFLKKVIEWFRTTIHPQLLLQIGLQPTIAAGCIVRTPNKYFDFSMRKNFQQNSGKLLSALSEPGAKASE